MDLIMPRNEFKNDGLCSWRSEVLSSRGYIVYQYTIYGDLNNELKQYYIM